LSYFVKIRVRDEGFRITFTIKDTSQGKFEKTTFFKLKYEVNVDNYDMMNIMLHQLNLEEKYQLNKFREIYKSKNGKNEVIFDHFPGLPGYMEIESLSEKELEKTMKLFGVKDEP
jgi:adenylate cyclase class IV